MKEQIIIPNKSSFEAIKEKIIYGGLDNLHIIADFDRTMTKAFDSSGNKVVSTISHLREKHYIDESYSKKAKDLFSKYHPIEMDVNISEENKRKAMNKWWNEHFDILIESGLNKKHLKQIVNEGNIEFRDGVLEFLDILNDKKIPLIIMSSNGVGDCIEMQLEKHKRNYQNIYIITNTYNWDKDGNAISVKKPIIHVMNKTETTVKHLSCYNEIKQRKNVLLLGDGLGDVGMIEGFNYDNLLKIGFLNYSIDESLNKFKENFDVLITNDGNFSVINDFLQSL